MLRVKANTLPTGIPATMIAGICFQESKRKQACLYRCGLPTCGVVLQRREERKRGRREQSKADQGGVEPPQKAGQGQ